MKTKLSISIMAHPSRKEWVEEIKTKMNEDIHVEWDRKISLWDTARRAWLSFDPTATHHLVLQDDIIPSKNLRAAVEKAIEYTPDLPFCLFIYEDYFINNQKKKYDEAYHSNGAWLRTKLTVLAPAIVMPTKYIQEMVLFGDKQKHLPADDTKIAAFFNKKNLDILITVPSLVEHRGSISLVGSKKDNRVAYIFIGEDNSGENLNWDSIPTKN